MDSVFTSGSLQLCLFQGEADLGFWSIAERIFHSEELDGVLNLKKSLKICRTEGNKYLRFRKEDVIHNSILSFT